MGCDMLQARIEATMAQVEQPAILAMRPYPPVDLPDTCSQLGGLPILPSEASWPRATDGTPLHFLARIDCFELPQTRGPLPEYGVLQFFARIDEEMVWDGPAAGYARVLYTQRDAGQATQLPADLPPIMGGWHDYDREMRLPHEPHTQIYPHWPLTFRSIRSWPRLPPIDLTLASARSGRFTIAGEGVPLDAYLEAVERARAAEIVRTTGRPTNPLRQRNGVSSSSPPTASALCACRPRACRETHPSFRKHGSSPSALPARWPALPTKSSASCRSESLRKASIPRDCAPTLGKRPTSRFPGFGTLSWQASTPPWVRPTPRRSWIG
jgi:hypothetical protein